MNHNLADIPRYKLRGFDIRIYCEMQKAIREFTEPEPNEWIAEAMSWQGLSPVR
jgi:hypothetical protein